jgi:hypothetical protein
MSISSAIQKHYHQKTTLSIDNSLDTVRHTFAKLETTDIVCGDLFNPFTSRYKLKIRCNGDIVYIDGPFGLKLSPLITKIAIEPSMSRNCTILNLVMQFPIEYINIHLITTVILCVLTLCLQSTPLGKLAIVLFYAIFSHIFALMYFKYSSKIILKYLRHELLAVDRI